MTGSLAFVIIAVFLFGTMVGLFAAGMLTSAKRSTKEDHDAQH